jgi:predicted metal-binding protein
LNQKVKAKNEKIKSLNFLLKKALELGATDAKIIPSEKIVIENRILLKCKLGCEKYGQTLACPPYAPLPDEIRKIVREYRYVMFMKFKSRAQGDSKLIKNLTKTNQKSITPEMKAEVESFWSDWNKDLKKQLETVLELEKTAGEKGYILAIGFVSGSCSLCEKCNLDKGFCVNPAKRRYAMEAVGVNVKATAEKAGIEFTMPFIKNPETYALLLID